MGRDPGRIQPLTIVVPVRRWWSWWLRLSWPAAERVWPINRITKGPLLGLRFINFAHFGLVTRVGERRMPRPSILFQTNFNGDAEAYIDAFALQVGARIRLMAAGAYGWPGTRSRGRFRAWFAGRIVDTRHHFWTAYPDASAKEAAAALALGEAFGRELADAGALDDAAFARRWQRFLDEHAELL